MANAPEPTPQADPDAPLITAYRHSSDEGWSIEPASPRREWMDATTGRFAYRCLPLVMANQLGWEIRSPFTFEVTWTGKVESDALKIRVTDGPQQGREVIRSNFGHGILSVLFPWIFRTPEGIGVLVRGAPNRWTPYVTPLEGLVETSWTSTTYLMNWQMTARNKQVWFKKEDPICVITPFPLTLLPGMRTQMKNVHDDPQLVREMDEFARKRNKQVVESRKLFEQGEKFQVFELDYVQGKTPTGQKAEMHLTNMKLRAFPK